MRRFSDRVEAARSAGGDVVLLLRPLMSDMPAPMHFEDDPFFPFSRAIIQATRDVVCGYVFDFAAYMAQAGAGARALERSIAYVGRDRLKVLHGPFVGGGYIPMVYEAGFGADAATLADERDLPAYLAGDERGALVVRAGDVVSTAAGSVYWPDAGWVTLAGGDRLRVAGEGVLYAGYGDDFAGRCRARIEALRDG